MPTFGSLFTCGGLADIGASLAGFTPIWGVELNPKIASIAEHNLGHKVFKESVIGFDWHKLDKVDHLHMSPPCQDFSEANRSGKTKNLNSNLIEACLDAVKVLEPQTITLENVIAYKKYPEFQKFVAELYGLGYWVDFNTYDACYLEVPQNRNRLFMMAVNGMMLPTISKHKKIGWFDAVSDLLYQVEEYYVTPQQYKAYGIGRCLADREYLIDHSTSGFRLASLRIPNQPTPSLTTKLGFLFIKNATPYKFSIDMYKRVQTVPDWYEIPNNAGYILGNGIPCNMMKNILLDSFSLYYSLNQSSTPLRTASSKLI